MDLIAKSGEREQRLSVERDGETSYTVRLGDHSYRVDARRAPGGNLWSLIVDDGAARAHHAVGVAAQGAGAYTVSVTGGASAAVEVADPLTFLARQGYCGKTARGGGRVVAYMPGRVVALLVAAGDQVVSGQGLLVLEAMKMQNEIQAELAGTVLRVCVAIGQAVDGGELLFEFG